MAADVDASDPVSPRKRKVPQRFEEGSAAREFHSTPKDLYRQVYYEALDLLVQAINDRLGIKPRNTDPKSYQKGGLFRRTRGST